MSRLASISLALLLGCSGLALAQTPQTAPTRPQPNTTQPQPAQPSRQPAGQTVEFRTEMEAKGHCPTDRVVWVNTNTKIYHYAGTHNYGKTNAGAYICERDAGTAGFRAAANEKPPPGR